MVLTLGTIERTDLLGWYRRNRAMSAALFGMVVEQAYEARPIPLRHPIVFYEGHFPTFSFITLNRLAFGDPSIDPDFEALFQRGIDPSSEKEAAKHSRPAWPSRDAVRAFAARCDDAVVGALAKLQSGAAPDEKLAAQAAYTILEHEHMHHETLLYLLHRLPYDQKRRLPGMPTPSDGQAPSYSRVVIPDGDATIGADPDKVSFGWDNEFRATRVRVEAFEMDAHSVTNQDWLQFVEAGGPQPPFWILRDGQWRQMTMFEEIPLPLAWPVYVSQEQATAYADWKGMRLPSEAQFHRAAFGSLHDGERDYPWGADPPNPERGNFGFQRMDPVAAGSSPDGASAWGIHDLVGNGWEWTSTPFGPLPGFEPMKTYPQYSADFFDGRHFVVKGASPVTARELLRRSFRNWYRANYPYMYAKFRCLT
jgi:formylglycine-generating enzyme required for sulfatase activity